MKSTKIVPGLAEAFENAATQVTMELFDSYENITGKEEDITGGLRAQLSLNFINKVKKIIGDLSLPSINLKVQTFKKKNENITGADLGIIFRKEFAGNIVTKAVMVQSKVGVINPKKKNIYASDSDILSQAKKMLSYSSDSFFFVYTPDGIKVFSAMEVVLIGKNCLNSSELYYHDFGEFIREFFKCFVGDHHISGILTDEDYLVKDFLPDSLNNLISIEAKISK